MQYNEWMGEVLARPEPRGAERLALLVMAGYADPAGECYPSLATLAADCAASPRGMQDTLSSLSFQGCSRVVATASSL